MRRTGLAMMVAMATMGGGPAWTQTPEAIAEAEAEVVEAWEAAPLSFRTTAFVTAAPTGFGIYEERADNVFEKGEPLIIYAEPIGYIWKAGEKDRFGFGFEVDLLLKKPDGEIVGGQENFQRVALESHARNREFMLTLTLSVGGAPAGDYIVV